MCAKILPTPLACQLTQVIMDLFLLLFFSPFSFLISLTLNKLRQRQMLEDKLAQRRKRRMEELEQKQMHETKVSNFLNCSQISCLREPETQASMDTFFTRKSTQKRVRKSSPK